MRRDVKDLDVLKSPDPYASPRMLDRLQGVRELASRLGRQHSTLG